MPGKGKTGCTPKILKSSKKETEDFKYQRKDNKMWWIIAAFIIGIVIGILLTVFYLGKLAI